MKAEACLSFLIGCGYPPLRCAGILEDGPAVVPHSSASFFRGGLDNASTLLLLLLCPMAPILSPRHTLAVVLLVLPSS